MGLVGHNSGSVCIFFWTGLRLGSLQFQLEKVIKKRKYNKYNDFIFKSWHHVDSLYSERVSFQYHPQFSWEFITCTPPITYIWLQIMPNLSRKIYMICQVMHVASIIEGSNQNPLLKSLKFHASYVLFKNS